MNQCLLCPAYRVPLLHDQPNLSDDGPEERWNIVYYTVYCMIQQECSLHTSFDGGRLYFAQKSTGQTEGSTVKETIKLRKPTDLFIRDAITGLGTIIKEDLENHYYITSVPVGLFGSVFSYAIICRNETEADIVAYAREGLIKQNLAEKTIQKLKGMLC